MKPSPSLRQMAAIALAVLTLTACQQEQDSQPDGPPPPPKVDVVTVEPEPLALSTLLPGRLEASRVAEVRARVAGIVLERVFEEGSLVEAGQVLYQIDPAPMQAAYNSARAALAKAKANKDQAQVTADRYENLVKTNAISQQEYDEAVATLAQAEADVEAARAALESARLELEYATVTAPITGQIGRALVTEGALVGQGEATPMAMIHQLDPIYINLIQTSEEVLELRRAHARGDYDKNSDNQPTVTLIMQDGQEYPHPGRLLFTDTAVDPSTGAVTLRALMPNPDRFLLPGMYVRARITHPPQGDTIQVPQQAVQRNIEGVSVMVVNDANEVEIRPVVIGRAHENSWVITEGLAAGDRVIVTGFQKIQPGTQVEPVPWHNPLAANKPGIRSGEAAAATPAD